MFDGESPADHQFHKFMVSRTSLPITPFSFPLNGSLNFEPYASSSSSSIHSPELGKPHLQSQSKSPKINEEGWELQPQIPGANSNFILGRGRLGEDAWSNDELLALLQVRSSIPNFNWERVSSKLGELGFKRSGDECKDKFEEERQKLDRTCRIFGEMDEFCKVADRGEEAAVRNENTRNQNVEEESRNTANIQKYDDDDVGQEMREEVVEKLRPIRRSQDDNSKKRKRKGKFEMWKALCEDVVNNMMTQQEKFQNRLIEDILKRDEESIAREEAWKNREMERMKKEIEIRTQEQASAVERQATMIGFLKKLSSSGQDQQYHLVNEIQDLIGANLNPQLGYQKNSKIPPRRSPNLSKDSNNGGKEDVVDKRWPRDQVLALINLRCKLIGSSGNHETSKESGTKGPLWGRISQGMLELGYRKSAKRCKEKWENINKYFRKTKDSVKKRSVDSRTCPYFDQLSCLYSEGTLVSPSLSNLSEN